jgi:hypothetical protein
VGLAYYKTATTMSAAKHQCIEVRAVPRIESFTRVPDVRAHRMRRAAELRCDGLVRHSPPEESDYLALALGEAVDRTYGTAPPLPLSSIGTHAK